MSAPSRRAIAALALVSTINLLNFADRYVIAGVQELIKLDKTFLGGARDAAGQILDSELGYLGSIFVLVVVIASPFAGWLGDRLPRRFLIFGGVLLWSMATFASGLAPSFGTLLVARACIGIGEAGYATVAPGLLSDLFDPSWRGKAMGVFNVMLPVGSALGFGVGAWVGEHYGWRHAFYVAGTPGFVLAVLALTMPDPPRGALDADPHAHVGSAMPPWDAFPALLRNRSFRINCIGQTLLTFTVGGLAFWMPTFFVRQLGFGQAEAGTWFGGLVCAAGLGGTVAGTIVGEIVQRKNPNGYFIVSGASLLAAVPVIVFIASGPARPLVLAATFVALFLVLFNSAPLYTALVNAVPAGLRSSAMALNLVSVHLLGDALAGPLIGKLSDATGSLAVAIGASAVPVFLGGLVLVSYKHREPPLAVVSMP